MDDFFSKTNSMQSVQQPPPLLNTLLGMGLVSANSLLFYVYFYLEVELGNKYDFQIAVVGLFASAQLLLLALTTRTQPHRKLLFAAFWLVLGLGIGLAGLFYLAYLWARGMAGG